MSKRQSFLERASNLAILAAALIVGVVALRRELRSGRIVDRANAAEAAPPSFIAEWKEVATDGLAIGDSSAPVSVIVFTDLECPFCARFHLDVLPALRAKFDGRLAVTVMHFPIKGHRFAVQSAVALECAAYQRSAGPFLDLVYGKQDSIGLKPWTEYARESGVPDLGAFAACLGAPPPQRIASGKQWAQKLGVTSAPTILVNGWRLNHSPRAEEFGALVDELLVARPPSER